MRDTELYRHLLGLVAPWEVNRVELSVVGGRVDVWVEHPKRTRFACPGCERELAVYDHAEQRAWRHLDSCAFLTFLHADPPRVSCPERGVRQVRLPWAEPHSRSTTLFERLAIDVLAACDVSAAARLLRVNWDEAWHLMDRAVARGLAAKPLAAPVHVGVDEKAAGRGQATSPWSATWTPARCVTSPTSGARPAWTASSTGSATRSWPASRRWPWICGSPTPLRCAPTCPTPTARSCSTGITQDLGLLDWLASLLPVAHRMRSARPPTQPPPRSTDQRHA